MPRRLVNQKDYARHIRRTPQYVSKLVRQGKIPREKDGRIDVARADRALAASRSRVTAGHRSAARAPRAAARTAAAAPSQNAVGRVPFGSLTAARTRREQAEAEMAELKLKQQRLELLPAADVRAAEQKKNSNLRTRIRRVARAAAGEVARLTDPSDVEDALLRQLDQVLRELAADPLGLREPVQTSAAPLETIIPPPAPTPAAETGALPA